MPRINPDPHVDGYVYQPTNSVTAFLNVGQDVDFMLRALSDAGCKSDTIDVFTGVQGAEKLDLLGKNHGTWVRFRRGLENSLADESEAFHRVDGILQAGGTFISVFTDGNDVRKDCAARVLKTHNGHEVTFWGQYTIDRL